MLRGLLRLVVVGMLFCLVASCALVQGKPKEIKADRVRQFTLHVDERFSKADRDVVIDSFVEWERDTHGIVRFVVSPTKWDSTKDEVEYSVDDDGCTVDVFVASLDSKHKSIRDFEKGPNSSKGNTLGYTKHQCDEKFVAFVMDRVHESREAKTLRFVGVHEAGHLIGLAHIPVPDESIMFPSMDHGTVCPTKLDMKQFCLLYGCDWREMKVCD